LIQYASIAAPLTVPQPTVKPARTAVTITAPNKTRFMLLSSELSQPPTLRSA